MKKKRETSVLTAEYGPYRQMQMDADAENLKREAGFFATENTEDTEI
jgi:hypothetical protein